ncbi:hypothetical protein RCL1_000564 [Eukaryota sp. TZLM3-RCL]
MVIVSSLSKLFSFVVGRRRTGDSPENPHKRQRREDPTPDPPLEQSSHNTSASLRRTFRPCQQRVRQRRHDRNHSTSSSRKPLSQRPRHPTIGFFICHMSEPISIPDHFSNFSRLHIAQILKMFRESPPDLQRQGKYLFDTNYGSHYANYSDLSRELLRQIEKTRSMWIHAFTNNLDRFLILKHWDANHQLIADPIWIVKRERNSFSFQSTTSWILLRKKIY